MINSRWRHSLLDVQAKRGADCGSDHYLLLAKIKIKLRANKDIKKNTKTKFNTEKLKK